MAILKGGRGQKAPWESTHVRCPVPIKERIESKIEQWKAEQLGEETYQEQKPLTDIDYVTNLAKKVLKRKKSARVSIEMMLTEIYGEFVSLSE